MKVIKAIFEFRGWRFEFEPGEKREWHGRMIIKWYVKAWHNKELVYNAGYLAFVPSAYICRTIIKHNFKKPMSAKRKKQVIKNLR